LLCGDRPRWGEKNYLANPVVYPSAKINFFKDFWKFWIEAPDFSELIAEKTYYNHRESRQTVFLCSRTGNGILSQ
jgi:hypothetical protein